MDSYTRHREYIYSHTEKDLFINLFIPSELNWKSKAMKITQETKFPYDEITTLKFDCEKDAEMGLLIRYPLWLSEPMTVKVNGEVQSISPLERYVRIDRKWKTGDIVEVKLPMKIRIESTPDDKNKIAFFHGPILLGARLRKDLADELTVNNIAPALIMGDKPLEQWLKPTDRPLIYNTTIAKTEEITLEPLYTIKTGAFTVYFQKMTEKEWNERSAFLEKRKTDLIKLGKITVDKVTAGDEVSEKKHNMTGSSIMGNGNGGILTDLVWRRAQGRDGFSYEMKVPPDVQVELVCKFMGRAPSES